MSLPEILKGLFLGPGTTSAIRVAQRLAEARIVGLSAERGKELLSEAITEARESDRDAYDILDEKIRRELVQ